MKEEKNTDIFPKHFFWGASTSSHQVEGFNHNQWSVWEMENAKALAQTAHQRYNWLPNWSRIKSQAEEPNNYVSNEAVDHYHKYEADFDIIQSLNLNSFRFSIEWSRIEPQPGKWDEKEIRRYKRYIYELRQRKLEPFLTLWHWTVPVWFAEKGGFEKKQNIKYFKRFVKKVADNLIDEVEYVITLNEPNVDAISSYLLDTHPRNTAAGPRFLNPMIWRYWMLGKVYYNYMRAHREAYKVLKQAKPALNVGLASQLANIQSKRPHNYIDQTITQIMRYAWNWWFLNRVKKQQDFIGVNYYFSDYYRGFSKSNPKVPINDLGWYMEPEGIYPLLLRVWDRFKKPIFITESGVADADDSYRQWWIQETIVSMEKALSEGVDLRGYMYWSLLDNFEWQDGWWPKFGLVEVDRDNNLKRKPRPSAKWFAEWLAKLE